MVLFFERMCGANYTSAGHMLVYRLHFPNSPLGHFQTYLFDLQCFFTSSIWLTSILSCLIRETSLTEPNTTCLRLGFPGRYFYSNMFSAYNNTHHIIILSILLIVFPTVCSMKGRTICISLALRAVSGI